MIGGGIAHDIRVGSFRSLVAVTALLVATACQPPPAERVAIDRLAAKRGLQTIERVQCAACHDIPGVRWPKGRTGPSLHDVGLRGAIAATLPNRSDVLAAFIRSAPSVKPGSPMPPMPVTQHEARDIAAYLIEAGQ